MSLLAACPCVIRRLGYPYGYSPIVHLSLTAGVFRRPSMNQRDETRRRVARSRSDWTDRRPREGSDRADLSEAATTEQRALQCGRSPCQRFEVGVLFGPCKFLRRPTGGPVPAGTGPPSSAGTPLARCAGTGRWGPPPIPFASGSITYRTRRAARGAGGVDVHIAVQRAHCG